MDLLHTLGLDPSVVLRVAASRGGDYVELFAEQRDVRYVVVDNQRVEQVTAGNEIGIGVRVMHRGHIAYASGSLVTQHAACRLAEAAAASARDQSALELASLRAPSSSPILPGEAKGLSAMREIARAADAGARSVGRHVTQVETIAIEGQRTIAVAASDGRYVVDRQPASRVVVTVTASDGEQMLSRSETAANRGYDAIDVEIAERIGRQAAVRARHALGAGGAPSGRMPVVLAASAGGTFVHEALGHGLEADSVENDASIYAGRLGETIASPLLTIVDDATLPRRGSYGYDDEGTPAQRTVLVDDGVLVSYLYDLFHARAAGVASTGNGRRESFEYGPLVRMSNILIEPGTADPDAIIRDTHNGLYVTRMGGGEVESASGDFVFEVQDGFVIRGGQLAEPVRSATIAGNGPEVLSGIDLVGTDLGYETGNCIKEGQSVSVADAQPTLRVPAMIVGGSG